MRWLVGRLWTFHWETTTLVSNKMLFHQNILIRRESIDFVHQQKNQISPLKFMGEHFYILFFACAKGRKVKWRMNIWAFTTSQTDEREPTKIEQSQIN